MSTGTTASFTVTRDKLIELAHKIIGVLEPGQVLDGEQLQDGIQFLDLIVRETDGAGKWRWTIQTDSHIPLAANTAVYTSANGLPTNIAELLTVFYRDSSGNDWPIDRLKAESYEALPDKDRIDIPRAVYLSEDISIANRILYVYGMLASVAAQSVVTGTDTLTYQCVRSHTAAAVNRPITGANWRLYWQLGGSSPSTWVSGTAYTAPDQLRITYRRPIYDFTQASDTPDFPMQWPRLILFRLADDLGDLYGIPLDERNRMIQKAKASFTDIFAGGGSGAKAQSSRPHNKARYY